MSMGAGRRDRGTRVVWVVVVAAAFWVGPGASPAPACSCVWSGPFLEVQEDSDLVAKVRVESYGLALRSGEDLYQYMRT